jgi:beta-galactosidase
LRSCLCVGWALVFLAVCAVRAESRLTLNFDPDWKFIKADPANAFLPDFDDHLWKTVSLPHTYNDVDTFDDMAPGRMLGETNQWSGRTWYRKTFTLPETFRGREVYVEFEAVRQVGGSISQRPLPRCLQEWFCALRFQLDALH